MMKPIFDFMVVNAAVAVVILYLGYMILNQFIFKQGMQVEVLVVVAVRILLLTLKIFLIIILAQLLAILAKVKEIIEASQQLKF